MGFAEFIESTQDKLAPFGVRVYSREDEHSDLDVTKNEIVAGLILRAVNLVTFIAMLIVTGINAASIGPVSDRHPTRFTPASWAFGILYLIYFSLACFCLYQFIPLNRWGLGGGFSNRAITRQINLLFIAANMANLIWVLLWVSDRLWASAVMMLCILASLVGIYAALRWPTRDNIRGTNSMNVLDYTFIKFPFSIFLSWICFASIANFVVAISANNSSHLGWTAENWSALLICMATLLTFTMLSLHGDLPFAAVMVWGLAAIMSLQQDSRTVYITAAVCISLIAVVAAVVLPLRFVRWRKHASQAGILDKEYAYIGGSTYGGCTWSDAAAPRAGTGYNYGRDYYETSTRSYTM